MSTTPALSYYLEGLGLLGPGLSNWAQAAPVLAHATPYAGGPIQVPAPDCLPPAERRRVGLQVKMALAVGREAVAHAQRDAATLSNVFCASAGDAENCHAICETLASADRQLSPTRFHNSVHNAAAGYWGIAMKCMAPSTSLSAHDGSFAAGLLEAAMQLQAGQDAVLLIACDTPYPEPLHRVRPLSHGFGVAMVLTTRPGVRALARLTLRLSHETPVALSHAALESLRTGNPAARALPLLQAVALARPATVHLPYLAHCSLSVALDEMPASRP